MQIIINSLASCQRHLFHLAHKHDEWPLFRIWFSVLTIVASIVLNLGIFVVLVLMHMALDIVKYRTRHNLPWHWVFVETMRESLMDIFFIVLGILLGIIFHHSIAIGGLGRMAELEVLLLDLLLRVGPRIKIAEHLLEVILYWRHHFESQFVPRTPLHHSEKGLLIATLAIALGITAIPLMTNLRYGDIAHTMAQELTPKLEFGIMKTVESLRSPEEGK